MGSFLERSDIEVASKIGKIILLVFSFVYLFVAFIMFSNEHIFPAYIDVFLALFYAYSYLRISIKQINHIVFSLHFVCIIYAIFMVFYFGWGFGAQYFIIPCIAFCYVGQIQKRIFIYSIAIFEMLVFEFLYFFMEFKGYSLNNVLYIDGVDYNRVFYTIHSFTVCVIIICVMFFLKVKINKTIANKEIANDLLNVNASKDSLTNLLNRWAFVERIKVIKVNTPIHFAIIDIDFFKNINDTYGHSCGDDVLIRFATLVNDTFSKHTDMIARWGGEEFLVFAHSCDNETFYGLCEKFQNDLSNISFAKAGFKVSASIGCLHINKPFYYDKFSKYISDVDSLLYLAKNNGRNKIESKVIQNYE